ncbi:MAG: IMP cyclohydrolase, partial [Mailhella sp.]|nr:IMP cyclohydrolase [Mailhella sp.]
MSDLKKMYSQIVADEFPETLKISLGEHEICYKKRTWDMDGEIRGLRYGENPDQPAARYGMHSGELARGTKICRAAKSGISEMLTEK